MRCEGEVWPAITYPTSGSSHETPSPPWMRIAWTHTSLITLGTIAFTAAMSLSTGR